MSTRNIARAAAQLPYWPGETVFILGGGPSLRQLDCSKLSGRRVIAVNEAGLSLYPHADVMFWGDRRFVEWNLIETDRMKQHLGPYRITTNTAYLERIPRARLVTWTYRNQTGALTGFDSSPGCVAGFDAGGRCINLAYHLGATQVVLLGFECKDYPKAAWRKGNFHNKHKLPPLPNQRTEKFIPAHEAMAHTLDLLDLPFRVWNATPDSALTCWPKRNLETFL